ncbi:MAG: ATP-binding protein, partial [Novosphingobium sp.]
ENLRNGELAPPIAALVEQGTAAGIVQNSRGGELLTLAVKASRDATGHVITFEDITRQLLDQRTAAWSDVARRIAHEIKNPLTPIQLATERLSRRYRKQITDNPELFEDLTRTIIRQVGDLRKMVDEFSSFARLPKPVFRAEDPVALTRQALFLQEVSRPDIAFSFSSDSATTSIDCDRHQFGQAMTNVLKNAVEAVEAKAKDAGEGYQGAVLVEVTDQDDSIVVRITDNGIGLSQDRERIIEPYVTTREKGTGLGLAIVNKIIEEHGGEMMFTPAPGGGTTVTMRFAHDPLAQGRKPEAAE